MSTPPVVQSNVTTDRWEKYRDDLAGNRNVDFGTVVSAYRGIEGMHTIIAIGEPPEFATDTTAALNERPTGFEVKEPRAGPGNLRP